MENFDDIDDQTELDDGKHKHFIDNILNLNRRQFVKKPTRTEPTAHISEYTLVKSLNNSDDVSLHELTRSLKDHANLRKRVKKIEKETKTLPKPLEKPEAERLKRSVAYEDTKKQLERWDPLVTANRVSTNLSFPLKDPNFDYKEARDFTTNWVLKSNLEKELEKIDAKMITYEIETEDKLPTSMEEMLVKRKEFEKLRRYQNYQELKQRWKNKIKSKTFRKIARKEKIKEQMKEFELLQKTDPEQAMKKLEEIEKARAEERASLRHKSTGKWARNHQIRAKYDKESRIELAQQLAISRDLTKKQLTKDSSESEDDNDSKDIPDITENENDGNEWFGDLKPSEEVKEFFTGYKKFTENKLKESSSAPKMINNNNKVNIEDAEEEEDIVTATEEIENPVMQNLNNNEQSSERVNKQEEKQEVNVKVKDIKKYKENLLNTEKHVKNNKLQKTKRKLKTPEHHETKETDVLSKNRKRKKRQNNSQQLDCASTAWDVTPLTNMNVDDIFDNIEYKMKSKVNQKYKNIKTKLDKEALKQKLRTKKNKKGKPIKESPVVTTKKAITNQELPKPIDAIEQNTNTEIAHLKSIIDAAEPTQKEKSKNSILAVSTETVKDLYNVHKNTLNPEGLEKLFEDDELVDEFAKEKNEEIEKDRPKDIDLSIPGWGSWGGQNLAIPKRKQRKFLFKTPKVIPRKDMNQGHLIINESANDNIKPHLVDEVPFPFKTVKDFEASIRAPIGNTFVPETAFRRMIKPAVQTRMGSIIEPVTEDVLLKATKKEK